MTRRSRSFLNASPEFRLIAACCRWPENAPRSEAVHTALQHPLQWKRVLFLTQRHRVGGLVSHALLPFETVPQDVRHALAKAKQDILLANMQALRTQVRLKTMFEQAGLPFAVLKGLPLAMQAYGNPALRQSRDIDLLVRQTDVEQVEDILRSAGYGRSGLGAALTPKQKSLWMRVRKHFEYASTSGGPALELHWRTADNRYLMQLQHPFSTLEFAPVAAGVTLPVLSSQELLLDLCVHGAAHAWFRLKWVADINALLIQAGEDGQVQLLQAARRHDLMRPVLQAMHLCQALFQLPLAEAKSLPRSVRVLQTIATEALLEEDLSAPTATSDFVPKHLALSHLLLRSNWRYRLEEIRLNFTAPSDWSQIELPLVLSWMYPLFRLPLWIKRRWIDPALKR